MGVDGPSTPRPTSLKDDKEVKAKKQPEPKANVRDVIGGIEVQVANEWGMSKLPASQNIK